MAWSEIWEQPLATPNLSALIRRFLLARLDLFVLAPTSSLHQSRSAFALPLRCLERPAQPLPSFLEETKSANPGRLGPQRRLQLLAKEQAPGCFAESQPDAVLDSRGGIASGSAEARPKVALLMHTSHRCQEHL